MKIAMIVPDNRDEFGQWSDPKPCFGPAVTALLQGFEEFPASEVHVVSCVKNAVPSPEKIAPNIFYHSLVVPQWGWMRSGYFGCIRAVRRKLKDLRPDIVHGQGTERFAAMATAFSGMPNVVTIHGNMRSVAKALRSKPGGYHWCAARFENFVLRKTAGVFCNSGYTEELVRVRAKQTWRVPNALLKDFFRPLPEKQPANLPVLINVGHIVSYKNQLAILSVAEQLHREGLNFKIHFVGRCPADSSYGGQFLSEILKAENAGYGKLLGEKTTAEVVECLDRSAAMIHFPSEEAFGLVAAEGLARDLKFFGSQIGGIPDVVAGVEGAEIFDVRNLGGLCTAIENWIKTGCQRSSSAQSLMAQRYHPVQIARRHLEIYSKL